MGDIVLLLGNQAPHEVHQGSVARDDDGQPILDEAGQPNITWHAGARGDQLADWRGRGPHKVHALDPADSPHTRIVIPAERAHHVLADLANAWPYHSDQPASWVVVEDDGGDPQVAQQVRGAALLHFGIREPAPDVATMLVTNAGLDFSAAQLGGAGGTAVAKYVGITQTAITPAVTDTVLSGEITTAGGGLIRAAATYAHTIGASTYTLTVTFTANGTDVLPATAKGAGVFTASSVGTMFLEDAVSPNITWNASGDAGTITYTVTV